MHYIVGTDNLSLFSPNTSLATCITLALGTLRSIYRQKGSSRPLSPAAPPSRHTKSGFTRICLWQLTLPQHTSLSCCTPALLVSPQAPLRNWTDQARYHTLTPNCSTSMTAAGASGCLVLTWTSGKPNEWRPIMASAFGLLHFLGPLVFKDFQKGKESFIVCLLTQTSSACLVLCKLYSWYWPSGTFH